jgi:negative regulator of sigma E activity
MTRKLDIETRLDRSLANQVKAPQLGRGFDASVWARIEAAEQQATNPVRERTRSPSSGRWLLMINVVGVAVTALLVVIFGMQSFNDVSVSLPTPEVSAATSAQILKFAAQGITIVSVVFGLMFTPLGRRLRAELT